MVEDKKNDSRTRKWLITINNPIEKGFTREKIIELCDSFKGKLYYCISDEVGLNDKTPHTHIFIAFADACRFSTMKNKFPQAHLDMCVGTCSQNRDYVFKIGKWENDKKNDTNDPNSHYEWGDLPVERQGKRSDLDDLYDMIRSGMSNIEIYDDNSNFILQGSKIDKLRQELLFEKFKNIDRLLNVVYVFGKTGTGKTRDILKKFDYTQVYRVTDYKNPFDNYCGQDVLVLDEFRGQIPLWYMLDLLDRYPLQLTARYGNKCACFTKVYIVSNISLMSQYKNVQIEEKESFKAFLRRINEVQYYSSSGVHKTTVDKMNEIPIDCDISETPFKVI